MWARERMGVTVIRKVGGAEGNEAAKERSDTACARAHIPGPQLKVALILVAPLVVEKQENVDSTMQAVVIKTIEVCMHLSAQGGRPVHSQDIKFCTRDPEARCRW